MNETASTTGAFASAHSFPPGGARRLLILGGIVLVLAGMIFGDIFAVFVLHQNAGRVQERLLSATRAVAARDPDTVLADFGKIGKLLENRGTKVDTHVHVIDLGYIALLLGLLQPYVALSERRKKQLAAVFLLGATLLPVSVFLIYYVGLAYSPLASIGWASILADFGGLLAIVASAGMLFGLWRHLRGNGRATSTESDWGWAGRTLLVGGTLLVLAGFLHGAYYATQDLYVHEKQDVALLRSMVDQAAAGMLPAAEHAVNAYGALQGNKAVKIAAHAHIIEFGFLAILLAFAQPYVFLSERWKRRWVVVLLAGSLILPVFVLLELYWGLIAGGIADVGGLLVIIALSGMLVGVLRHTGKLDAQGT